MVCRHQATLVMVWRGGTYVLIPYTFTMAVFNHNTHGGLFQNAAPPPLDSIQKDDFILLERVDNRELDLIETAILHLLIDHGSVSASKHENFAEATHCEGSKDGADFNMCCSTPQQEGNLTAQGNFDLLSKLLKQVQILKSQKCSKDILQKQQSSNSQPEQLYSPRLHTDAQTRGRTEVKDATEAAVKAAMAAADAAKAAAVSISKNSEAIQSLLKTLTPLPDAENASVAVSLQTHEESEEGHETDKRKGKKKDIAKVLERQNRITHWILGFMVLATSIWRFKLVSLVLNFQRKINNPLESMGGIFSEGFNDRSRHHKYEGENSRALQFPHIELPTFFQPNENETQERPPS